jgi:hypothetical protein
MDRGLDHAGGRLGEGEGSTTSVASAPDGTCLVTAGGSPTHLGSPHHIWDPTPARCLPVSHSGVHLTSVAIAPDGT